MEGSTLSAPIHATEYEPELKKHLPKYMIRMIAACARNRVMGIGGTLPWQIQEDWDYFLKSTKGGALLMGRRCYEDFTDYAQNRKVVVLSRDSSKKFPYAHRAGNLQDGLDQASSLATDTWICGGEGIYREAMSLAEELYLTQIDAEYEGDVFFPEWENFFKREISRKEVKLNGLKLTFRVLGK